MHILDEAKIHFYTDCPKCHLPTRAYMLSIKSHIEGTIVYRCHNNHVWKKYLGLEVAVDEIG